MIENEGTGQTDWDSEKAFRGMGTKASHALRPGRDDSRCSALGVWGLTIGTLALSKTHISFSTAGVDEPSITAIMLHCIATTQDEVSPKPPASLGVPG